MFSGLRIFGTRKERMFNPDLHRLEIQALTNFLSSNKIEILNVAGPRESKEPGIYEWTFSMLRCFLNRTVPEGIHSNGNQNVVLNRHLFVFSR